MQIGSRQEAVGGDSSHPSALLPSSPLVQCSHPRAHKLPLVFGRRRSGNSLVSMVVPTRNHSIHILTQPQTHPSTAVVSRLENTSHISIPPLLLSRVNENNIVVNKGRTNIGKIGRNGTKIVEVIQVAVVIRHIDDTNKQEGG